MAKDLQIIENLFFSDEFSELNAYSNRFDLFKIMRIKDKELIHSNILAVLLNPNETHGMGYTFLNLFTKELKKCVLSNSGNNVKEISLVNIISTINSKVVVYRELDYIDLVIVFPEARVVIGIENKIWASERDKQIEDYQKAMESGYPDYHKALVFLTPTGRIPNTSNKQSEIPVYCMSYEVIAKIAKVSINNANQSAQFFLDQFIYHVESYMTGSSEIQELCWQIFQKHPDAYKRISNNFEYCVSRRIREIFDSISLKIGQVDFELELIHNKNNYDFNIRRNTWPQGIWIKIYKHGWFGIFPFVKEAEKNLIEQYFHQQPVLTKNWGKLYYFSSNKHLDKDRCIKSEGNEIDEENANEALRRLKQFVDEIDKAVVTASTLTKQNARIKNERWLKLTFDKSYFDSFSSYPNNQYLTVLIVNSDNSVSLSVGEAHSMIIEEPEVILNPVKLSEDQMASIAEVIRKLAFDPDAASAELKQSSVIEHVGHFNPINIKLEKFDNEELKNGKIILSFECDAMFIENGLLSKIDKLINLN